MFIFEAGGDRVPPPWRGQEAVVAVAASRPSILHRPPSSPARHVAAAMRGISSRPMLASAAAPMMHRHSFMLESC